MALFAAQQWISIDIAKVFPFFCDPKNFVAIMPPEIGTRLLSLEAVPPISLDLALAAAAGAGSRIEFSFLAIPLLPFRMSWIAEVVCFEPYRMFRDVQRHGPFASWEHTHGFKAEVRQGCAGTLITDEIIYSVGYGLPGRVVGEAVVKLALARTFAHRRKVIARILEGGSA